MEVAISDRPLSENNIFPLKKFKASVTCENKLLKGHGGSCSSVAPCPPWHSVNSADRM